MSKLSKKFAYEEKRILWRQAVLALHGGPAWLAAQAKKVRFKEAQLGPRLGDPGQLVGESLSHSG